MRRELIARLKQEVVPAVGCTEPVAIALAAANAAALTTGRVTTIKARISGNVYKNAKAVGIPGADQTGVDLALVLGAVICQPQLGLSIFSQVDEEALTAAKTLLTTASVQVEILHAAPVTIEVEVMTETDRGLARIEGSHTNVTYLEKSQPDGQAPASVKVPGQSAVSLANQETTTLQELPLPQLLEQTLELPDAELAFLTEGVAMNLAMAEAGLQLKEGLGIGGAYRKLMDKGLLARDLAGEMILYTVAACDARMSGMQGPVMTSCGSGNNGITITVPIAVAARRLKATDQQLAKALAVSHLVNYHIKSHIGKLSPICGCGVTAGAGVAAGLVYLLGGQLSEMEQAAGSVTASLAGMLCDGGKVGCALKLAAGVNMAYQCAVLAQEGIVVPAGNGIVGRTVDETLKNLGTVCRQGMAGVDETILNVMS